MEHAADPPACMDQPFLNYQAIKDDLHNNTALNPFVSLYEDNDIVTNEATSVLSHFSYPIGNSNHKFQRMSAYFLQKLSRRDSDRIVLPPIVGKTYIWDTGYIAFTDAGLETKWGKGVYEVLGTDRVKASWNGYDHYLTFSNDGSDYMSVRTKPGDHGLVFGNVQTITGERLYIHGDSHAMLLFEGLNMNIPYENLFEYGTTMHRIGRDGIIPKHRAIHNSKEATFVFVYGEVDCRAHIKRQVEAGRHAEDVCTELVNTYMKTIRTSITSYKSIIIVGVPPPADEADHTHGHVLPFIGTIEERVDYTRMMNALLETACAQNGYQFLAPFKNYTRPDGCLEYTLSDGCIHIGKNAEFLRAFYDLINPSELTTLRV
jgi:hypothetical protein